MHLPHCVMKTGIRYRVLFEMLVVFFVLQCPQRSVSGGAWWVVCRAAQSPCSAHGQVQTTGPVSLSVAMVKIFVYVCWVTWFGGVGEAGLRETNYVIKERTHNLSI